MLRLNQGTNFFYRFYPFHVVEGWEREHFPILLLQEAIKDLISCKTAGFRRYLDKLISASFNYYYWNRTAPLGIWDQIFCYNCLSFCPPEGAYLLVEAPVPASSTGNPFIWRKAALNNKFCREMLEGRQIPFPLASNLSHSGITQSRCHLKTDWWPLKNKKESHNKTPRGWPPGCNENRKANTTIRPRTETPFRSSKWSLQAQAPCQGAHHSLLALHLSWGKRHLGFTPTPRAPKSNYLEKHECRRRSQCFTPKVCYCIGRATGVLTTW